ncbi:sulfurtransferase [Caenimonas sedimenti]|uniref:Sulfurtransferase n=1 Tax=Caenimonas sedimenti TaxID=2596921 RepID=A0A562ZWR3_9BURK|nr:rhodanese-like domain-containing protein [Caenimonas sedimenti]TWO73040.1 sulfurtransferase [Caenimonas sedimenti]
MIPQVRPAELDAWLQAQPASAVVLDVREAWEVQTASVQPQDFELVTIPMSQLQGSMAQLDPERPTAVLCHHGARSQRVAMFLAQQGFTQLANIAGGIDAWSQERDPAVPRY